MGTYRKHLSGDMAFRSFVPTPLSEIRIVHTERLDKLIMEVEDAMRRLNAYAVQLIVQHDMKLERSVYEILQILGISLTDKTHLCDLFDKSNFKNVKD